MKITKERIAEIIKDECSFFNGWSICEETLNKTCLKAAKRVLRAVESSKKKKK